MQSVDRSSAVFRSPALKSLQSSADRCPWMAAWSRGSRSTSATSTSAFCATSRRAGSRAWMRTPRLYWKPPFPAPTRGKATSAFTRPGRMRSFTGEGFDRFHDTVRHPLRVVPAVRCDDKPYFALAVRCDVNETATAPATLQPGTPPGGLEPLCRQESRPVLPHQFPVVVARNEYGAALELRGITAEHKQMSSHRHRLNPTHAPARTVSQAELH
ncbi:MAG: hypothetical protein JWO57_2524 [Pseudonocardiales bacterium]|nr:hypothetical protein [Pseudonocardiales bacterium]